MIYVKRTSAKDELSEKERDEFPEDVRKKAFARAGGRCECTAEHLSAGNPPHRSGRCPRHFSYEQKAGEGKWEAHHIKAGGSGTLENCKILCVECHKLTKSYGKH